MRSLRYITVLVCLSIIPAGVAGSAFATSNYAYKPNEFPLITHGLSPDKRQSLRAHGQGDLGDDNFHVYLFNEAPSKRIGPLEEIVPLDTAPDAFTANWAPDSHAVAIEFRSDRHVLDTVAYTLANNRAYPIVGQSLIEAATKLKPAAIADDQTTSETTWAWSGAGRFTLTVSQTYRAKSKALLQTLGKFGRKTDDDGDGGAIVQFSAEADCELVGQTGYRILSLRPGKFPQ